ncbi:hypothetical protein Pcinc_034504 [Petrolisthes cinctipes]|uniref:Uncharacterized protein n=1 Tax=Petrolisthes cinctipes TaxID=88211 RepID=A0AAE1JZ28_PETCI|nr:hypothetical protein Pcinc_034504 [Petrolisthes cinctipes]
MSSVRKDMSNVWKDIVSGKVGEKEYTEYKESRKPRECRPGMRWGSQTGIGGAQMGGGDRERKSKGGGRQARSGKTAMTWRREREEKGGHEASTGEAIC